MKIKPIKTIPIPIKFESIINLLEPNGYKESQQNILNIVWRNEKVGRIEINTMCPSDTKVWETAIKRGKDAKWVIVEQYVNKEIAEIGHKKWIKTLLSNPEVKIQELDIWEI